MTLPPSSFAREFPVPEQIARRAWEAAFALRQEYSDRLDLNQNIRMEVLTMMHPERLGWAECGDALALFALVVTVRV